MESPVDDKDRGSAAARIAGVGIGILGSTLVVSGWFTLAPSVAATAEPTVITTGTGVTTDYSTSATIRVSGGRAHTRTGRDA